MPFCRGIGNRKHLWYFIWFQMVFIALKLIVLKKNKQICF